MFFPHIPEKKTGFVFLFVFVAFCLFAGGGAEEMTAPAVQETAVIVSTSWVAAIVDAAGVQNIRILAPVELRHPPEYELKPSDLEAVSRASAIVYGGWEMFAKKLAETAGGAGIQVIKVHTANSPDNLKAEAQRLAGLFGTTERCEAWTRRFDLLLGDLRARIQNACPAYRAVVHRAQLPFAQWAGLEIAAEYGPAELSPAEILRLVKTQPLLVVDNYHGPVARAVAEAAGAQYIQLLNFPGKDGTKTMEDLFRYNTGVLVEAGRK
jgi:ABC-type Zn uptake system ZnuABC Zn-binding protein ZnuA